MTEAETTWLQNLKAGDDVLLSTVTMKNKHHIVHRTTPSQVIILENGRSARFMKKTGRRLRPWNGWIHREAIKP